jgi:hypothetical protein
MEFAAFDAACREQEASARPTRRNVRILLIRHAESEANLRKGEIGGRQNSVSLSAAGVEQAKLLGSRLRAEHKRIDEVHASVATRATETARLACAEAGFPSERIIPQEQVVEQSQGSWERRRHRRRPPFTSPLSLHLGVFPRAQRSALFLILATVALGIAKKYTPKKSWRV